VDYGDETALFCAMPLIPLNLLIAQKNPAMTGTRREPVRAALHILQVKFSKFPKN